MFNISYDVSYKRIKKFRVFQTCNFSRFNKR